MNRSTDKTIYEEIAEIRADQKNRQDKAIKMLKAVHKEPVDISKDPDFILSRRMPYLEQSGAILKLSSNKNFKGWYRKDQTSGNPSKTHPIAIYLNNIYEDFYKVLIAQVPKAVSAKQFGQRSGKVRAEMGLQLQILRLHSEFQQQGFPKHHITKRIAARLNCNTEYVSRVLRKFKVELTKLKNTT